MFLTIKNKTKHASINKDPKPIDLPRYNSNEVINRSSSITNESDEDLKDKNPMLT